MADLLSGAKLAEAAHLFAITRNRYPNGVAVPDLLRDLELQGIRIVGDDPVSTLRTALNGDQRRWVNREGSWFAIAATRGVGTELSGRALAEALHAFVSEIYTTDRIFHYETAKERLMREGVRIKGPVTGRTTAAALAKSPDLFERVASRRGHWRWKDRG